MRISRRRHRQHTRDEPFFRGVEPERGRSHSTVAGPRCWPSEPCYEHIENALAPWFTVLYDAGVSAA